MARFSRAGSSSLWCNPSQRLARLFRSWRCHQNLQYAQYSGVSAPTQERKILRDLPRRVAPQAARALETFELPRRLWLTVRWSCWMTAALLSSACTPTQPQAHANRADCAVVPPVVRVSATRLVVRDGLTTTETDPVPSDAAAFWRLLRTMEFEGGLRPACSGEDAVVLPSEDTPVSSVFSLIRATSRCGGTTGLPLSGVGSPVPVHGLHFCYVPPEEPHEPTRCSQARIEVGPERIHLQRYAWGYPLVLTGPLAPPDVPRDERPPSLDFDFEGPERGAALLDALRAPHAGLPHCETASFRVDPQMRWGQLVPLLSTFHYATEISMLLD